MRSYEERKLRYEISKLASQANKRARNLEKNKLLSGAYMSWKEHTRKRKQRGFSSKGLTTQTELYYELHRIKSFLNSESSTVKGAITQARRIALNAGYKYKSIAELKRNSRHLFRLHKEVMRVAYEENQEFNYYEAVDNFIQSPSEVRVKLNSRTKVRDLVRWAESTRRKLS